MILYFTGTGNSRYAAQELNKFLKDELVSMNREMRKRRLDPYNARYAYTSEKPFIIVCPTYCWNVPRVVEEFLLDSRFLGSRDMYFVLTCGDGTGQAGKRAEKICETLSLNFRGLGGLRMPENFITLFRAPEPDEAVAIIRSSMPLIESIAMQILADRNISSSFAGREVPDFIVRGFYRFFVHDRKFRVKDNCSGCTACASLCPTVNIRMRDGKPEWQGHCTQCQSCIGVCPVDAIEFGLRTRRKRRYYLFADGRQKFPNERREAESDEDKF
jgi:ferredoxin